MDKLKNITKQILGNLPVIFGGLILAMDFIAIAAPVLAHFGASGISNWIYFVYQFFCHQRPWRSIHFFDYQVAWCTRDTFLYLSMGLSAIISYIFKVRNVKWYIPFLAILPFALDGGTQFIAEIDAVMHEKDTFFYSSTNFFRMLTGTIFGAGAGLFLFSMLDETVEEERTGKIVKRQKKVNNWKYFLLILGVCLLSYLAFVQIWRVTSDTYKPEGLLDHKRYYPGVNYEETGRCGHCS